MFAGNLEKDKEIKSPLLISREFDIKPSSHLLGKKFHFYILYTWRLNLSLIYYFPFRVSRVFVGVVEGEEHSYQYHHQMVVADENPGGVG